MRARCCHCAIKWVADHESLRVCGWALELLIHPKWVKSILRIRVLGLNATEKYLPKISINKLCFAVLDLANVNADAISPVCICKLVFVEEEAEAEFPAIGTVAEPVASTDKPDAYLFAMLFLFLFAPNWCVSVRLTMWRWANDNTISEQWAVNQSDLRYGSELHHSKLQTKRLDSLSYTNRKTIIRCEKWLRNCIRMRFTLNISAPDIIDFSSNINFIWFQNSQDSTETLFRIERTHFFAARLKSLLSYYLSFFSICHPHNNKKKCISCAPRSLCSAGHSHDQLSHNTFNRV